MGENSEETTIVLTVVNEQHIEIEFILEPWGEIFPLRVEHSFQIYFDGPLPGSPEVVVRAKQIVVWGWSGSTARIFDGEEELGVGFGPRGRVPQLQPEIGHA